MFNQAMDTLEKLAKALACPSVALWRRRGVLALPKPKGEGVPVAELFK
ncbi:MAG: hypothetical protein Q8N22_01565 [bacterium]|nr:hypothetical protein [bacterium]